MSEWGDILKACAVFLLLAIPPIVVAKLLWNHPQYNYIVKGIVVFLAFGALMIAGMVIVGVMMWILDKLVDFIWR